MSFELHHLLDWDYDSDVLRRLLHDGADPEDRCGEFTESALHVAVRRRRCDAITILLDHGADIDARTAGGMTAYRHASRRHFNDVARLLARRGAETTLTVSDELAMALMSGDFNTAKRIAGEHPQLIPELPPEEARLLPDLAAWGNLEAVMFLLDRGVDIAARGLDGGTALHQTAWFGQPEVARLLIERGAPLDIAGDWHDGTPLVWVCHGSRYSGGVKHRQDAYVAVAVMLLAAGASLVNPADPQGDPHGRRLMRDASEPVRAVLKRFGARE